jgi:hypothetical protein
MESKIRKRVESAGMDCRRIPLSGSAPGWAGDLILAGRVFEVKGRGRGFRQLYRWLEDRFGLVMSADRREPLLVMRLGDFLRSCQFRDGSDPAGAKTPTRDFGLGVGPDPDTEGRKEKREGG